MRPAFPLLFAFLLVLSAADFAQAIVVQVPVTPAAVAAKESPFAVTVRKQKDGLLRFDITYRNASPHYVTTHFALREAGAVVAATDNSRFVRDTVAATFTITVAEKRLADATLEVSENPFTEVKGELIAMPGGTIYVFDLQAFAKTATPPKAE